MIDMPGEAAAFGRYCQTVELGNDFYCLADVCPPPQKPNRLCALMGILAWIFSSNFVFCAW